jgi:hypothetical protein
MRLAVVVAVLAAPFVAGCEEEYEPPRTAAEQVVVQQPWGYGRGGVAIPPQAIPRQDPPPPDRRPQAERSSDPQWSVETYYVPPALPGSEYYIPPPHPIPRHTISLGFIGDWPLWSGGDPPPAPWWRPFPPAWERDYYYGRTMYPAPVYRGYRRWR